VPDYFIDNWGRVNLTSENLLDLFYNEIDIKNLNVIHDKKIEEYNSWCKFFNKTDDVIPLLKEPDCPPEEEHKRRSQTWFITDEYLKINVREKLLERSLREEEKIRVNFEMDMFEERKLIPLLQLMFALIDYFRKENIVWGVGRGSSCASYCLYLIGVHKIDSILYDLDIKEFLK